jgi:carboxyl-terminal processing protease
MEVKKARQALLFIALLVLMSTAAFVAGYFANDFIERRANATVKSEESDSFSLFWEAWGWVDRSYFGDLPSMQSVTYGAIRGALLTVGDPYTVFIEPEAREEERDTLRGNFGGIGAQVMRNEAGDVVLEPIAGNPAEAAGIVSGDVLLAVDGETIGPTMTVEEIAQIIRGEKGTEVTLTVRHPGASETVDIVVERGDILIPSVAYRLLQDTPDVGYIQLTRFSGESSEEIEAAIVDLEAQGARSLVIDLRGNGGGLLDAAIDVADKFLDDGPIMYQQSKGEDEKVFEASEGAIAGDLPLVVLVDHGTASSSEILAGALQDRGRATLIGSRTFGKGSVQLVYDLSDGSSVHVTASRWLTPDRHQIDQQGLEPEVTVEMTQEAIDSGQDLMLEAAVDFLRSELADGN